MAMKDRSSVVIIENNQIVLIKRSWNAFVYYVFPGGGIENGETPEDAAKREAMEELGVGVNVNECISKVKYNGNKQYFYKAEILSGTIGTGQGDEYINKTRGRGTYLPIWVGLEKLTSIDVRPMDVALKVQSLFHHV